MTPAEVRRLWALIEPIHDVTYFAPQAKAAFEAVNLRGFWRGYFAGRSAPLGAVGAAPVMAIFYVFAPQQVNRALPDVWSRATPEAVLAARSAGAAAAIEAVTGSGEAALAVGEVADLLAEAAAGVGTVGRPLSAANAALPVPDGVTARLWHYTTVLRENRGDGHWATLLCAGVDGCEALVWREAVNGAPGVLQASRGWADEEWAAARDRLATRDWLNADGTITDLGRQRHDEIEQQTDHLAAAPWQCLDEKQRTRLAELLTPLSKTLYDAIPINAMGVPRPT
jgi:hypothetical protein